MPVMISSIRSPAAGVYGSARCGYHFPLFDAPSLATYDMRILLFGPHNDSVNADRRFVNSAARRVDQGCRLQMPRRSGAG